MFIKNKKCGGNESNCFIGIIATVKCSNAPTSISIQLCQNLAGDWRTLSNIPAVSRIILAAT